MTLATRMASKHLPVLDLSGSAAQVTERWRKWKRAFEYYAEGQGITDAKKKTAQLLHYAGMELQDLFEDLPDPGPAPEDDDEYKKAIRKLDNRFKTEENFPYERHVFRQMKFNEGETADQFVTRLRKQARHCNFGVALEDNLRDQLIHLSDGQNTCQKNGIKLQNSDKQMVRHTIIYIE